MANSLSGRIGLEPRGSLHKEAREFRTETLKKLTGPNLYHELQKQVIDWMAKTKQPKFDCLYSKLIYQPQLELLDYLRANGFKTFIVSGGGIAFMMPFTEKAYGIPPEQVIGSMIESEFQIKDGKAEIVRLPKIHFIDDKAGKPVGIYNHIGRRPILAFGNSDSDMQMVEYTTAGEGPRLGL